MKSGITRTAASLTGIVAVYLLCLGTLGTVEDKRAPGYPGEKTHQVQVHRVWITVSDEVWDRCDMYESFPACLASDKN